MYSVCLAGQVWALGAAGGRGGVPRRRVLLQVGRRDPAGPRHLARARGGGRHHPLPGRQHLPHHPPQPCAAGLAPTALQLSIIANCLVMTLLVTCSPVSRLNISVIIIIYT